MIQVVKKLAISAITLLIGNTVLGQTPQTVTSITVELHENEWYEEQLGLWKAKVEKNNLDANAWYNYYSAARALMNLSEWGKREEYIEMCHEIADKAIVTIPETFEANHIYWWDGKNDNERMPNLLKAHELDPEDKRAFDDLLIHHELARDTKNRELIAKKMVAVNALPQGILNWGYNILSELEPNAIIFTAGDNDTYGIWLIQSVFNYRKDVHVFNAHLFSYMPEYRKKLVTELNWSDFQYPNEKDEEVMYKCFNEVLKKASSEQPVYVSSSCGNLLKMKENSENFYLTGLAYKYCENQFDNVSVIRGNYEQKYLIDYLDIQFVTHQTNKVAEHFDALYLPSLVKLYCHYSLTGETQKKEGAYQLLMKVGERTGRKDMVEELLSGKEK